MAVPALVTVTIAQGLGQSPRCCSHSHAPTPGVTEDPACRPVSIPDLPMQADNVPAAQGLAGQGQV